MDKQGLIIGGGVGGLAIANALAMRGIQSCVVERATKPGTIDRGDVIHAGAWSLLEKWGVTKYIPTDDRMRLGLFQICDGGGKVDFELRIAEDLGDDAAMTVVRHPDIERALEKAALASGQVEIRRGVACAELLRSHKRVVGARMDNGLELHAEFTIVATGAISPLAEQHFGPVQSYDYDRHFYNLLLDGVAGIPCAGRYYVSPAGIIVMVPLPQGLLRVGFQVRSQSEAQILRDPDKLLHEIRHRCREFPQVALHIREGHFYHLSRRLAAKFWIPGAAIIGDAAHTVHPTGGQGMNIAFKDAEYLATAIYEWFSDRCSEEESLSVYSRRRRAEVTRIQNRTHVLGLLSECDGAFLSRARGLCLRAFNHLGFIKRSFCRRFVTIS
jgi:2-polyprenyl-6-methoxyphenol hydroxylase-like FAD-dependent oxidoreductase